MKLKRGKDQICFNLVGGLLVGIISIICLIPFVLIVSGSFSEESLIITNGYSILPQGFTLNAYKTIFKNPQNILYGYRNTILYTIVGTAGGVFFSSMTGYVLSRKYFPWRNQLAFFFYFTTLFSGGLVPTYLWNMSLGAKNSWWIVVVPSMLSMFNILLMRNFIASVPDAIAESAKIDGAGEFTIYTRLILPLIKPVVATVGLFLALAYWNSWYACMLYVTDPKLQTLQYNLYRMLTEEEVIKKMMQQGITVSADRIPPSETVKLAMTCVVTGPILLLYPYIQKYFVKGITVGAVKG